LAGVAAIVPAALFTRAVTTLPGSTDNVAGSTTIGGGVAVGRGAGDATDSGAADSFAAGDSAGWT
jgi:hypothetical protein